MGSRSELYYPTKQIPQYGANVVMTVTNLQSLVNSQTVGWQSARVSNLTTLATDYRVLVKLTTANTAPANFKAMYVYVVGWFTSDAGSTWFPSSGGTGTLPSGSEAGYTLADPNDFKQACVLKYTTTQMIVQDSFLLSNVFGNSLPHAWSLVIINFSGANLSTSCIVDYIPVSMKNI